MSELCEKMEERMAQYSTRRLPTLPTHDAPAQGICQAVSGTEIFRGQVYEYLTHTFLGGYHVSSSWISQRFELTSWQMVLARCILKCFQKIPQFSRIQWSLTSQAEKNNDESSRELPLILWSKILFITSYFQEGPSTRPS